jgi:hypothetical protein
MTPAQIKTALYALAALVIGSMLWWAHHTIDKRGYERAKAECVAAADKAEERNDQAASEAGDTLNKSLGQTLPRVETNAYESAERIRTVYVDRPVPAGCAWDGRVLEELEGGRQAANRAVRGGAGVSDPADPAKP